jgi:hypothetical protein
VQLLIYIETSIAMKNYIYVSLFYFLMIQNPAMAESLSISSLITKSTGENDKSLMSLAYKRCAGLNFYLNSKFAQSNLTDAASANLKTAELFTIIAAQQDTVVEQSRGITNAFKNINERQKHLIEGSISRIALFYANKSNENYVKNGSIISGDPLLESDFEMCKTMLTEALKTFK